MTIYRKELINKLDAVASKDQFRLARQIDNLSQRLAKELPVDKLVADLEKEISASSRWVIKRQQQIPTINYPDLPVAQRLDDLLQAIIDHQVVIVAGETGSGKTTQLPKICLQAGRGVKGLIGHTQPRRIAARTVSARISEELGVSLGQQVGYQVRFTDDTSDNTLIKLMTDGILLAEIQHDRFLRKYDTIIIDEAHERSLNIDFLLGYIKQLLPKRPDLKVIITSATIDVDRFAKHFCNSENKPAPIINVEGRSYPVEVDYLPINLDTSRESREGQSLSEQVLAAVDYIEGIERNGRGCRGGDILVFLPGERDIRDCALALRRQGPSNIDVLPLYARLGQKEQQRIFHPDGKSARRIVLATNVAETSITVPGIHYVIDSGLARVSRYSARSKIQRLPIEPVSQASANQRKGRCGRVAEGICVRLYSEQDFTLRPEFTDPEIQRTNLAAVILQMAQMKIGAIDQFPFIDKPDGRFVRDGERTLEELGAMSSNGKLTSLGWQLAKLPVDPRIARIILAGAKQGCLQEVLIIASAMSIQDPREYPAEKKEAAQNKHHRFTHKTSDLLAWTTLWNYVEQQRQELSKGQFRKLCQKEFLSFLRLQEWRDLHRQLRLIAKQLQLLENQEPANEEQIHKALLAGLVSQIGQRDEGREFNGTRGRRFVLFPGSALYKKPPNWVVSTELVETTKLYARNNGRIEPEWIMQYAKHLVKRQYKDPFWNVRRGEVQALETVSLYGLVISDNKRVSYGRIDEVVAREVFIRGCLVEQRYKGKAPFWQHNSQLLQEVEELEAKTRRADLALSDDLLYQFYDERIPLAIFTIAGFDAWRKKAELKNKQLLFINKAMLQTADDGQAQFPSELVWQDMQLPLKYRFEPGHRDDGVTVDLPVGLLNRVPTNLLEWLVPGLLRDKCIALVKTLPKGIRKNFVPVPEYVDQVLLSTKPDDIALTDFLAKSLQQIKRVTIKPDDWRPELLEPFYLMNSRIIDTDGKVLATGRNIDELVTGHRGKLQQRIAKEESSGKISQHSHWDFGDVKQVQQFTQGKVAVTSYPAVVEQGDKVSLRLLDSLEEAAEASRLGVIRLLLNSTAKQGKQLKKDLLSGNTCALHMAVFGDRDAFILGVVKAIYWQTFLVDSSLPRSEAEFAACLQQYKSRLVTVANEYDKLFRQILAEHYAIAQQLTKLPTAMAYVADDINAQLKGLLFDNFMLFIPLARLSHYPRYLKAAAFRLERLAGQYQKDKQATDKVVSHCQQLNESLPKGFHLLKDDSPLADYRWMIEEYRVSLYAQQLRTPMPVSDKRLQQCWERAQS